MIIGSEVLRDGVGQISFSGRVFDRRRLFSPTPEVVAARLAFSADWPGATARMDNFTEIFKYSDFSDGGRLTNPYQRASRLVGEIDAGYDPENETTLEMTAALIARREDFLGERGYVDDDIKYSMLVTAAGIEVARTRDRLMEDRQDPYYRAELDAIRKVRDGLRSLVRMIA